MENRYKIILFTGLLLFCITNLFAQAPDTLRTKTYGGTGTDVGYSVVELTGGGYIIAGYTNSSGAGSNDVYLIKTDADGVVIWEKTYGGTGDDRGYSVQPTSDGGYIIAGFTRSYGNGGEDVYLIKTYANGDTVWTKTYGTSSDERGYSVDELAGGGYIIAGLTTVSFIDDYLIKTDANGDSLWAKIYGAGMMSWWMDVQETEDGTYITAGNTNPLPFPDVYLAKTNSDGSTVWIKTINLGEDDFGNAVQETSDGGYIIAGETWPNSTQEWDFCLIKRDANGNAEWAKTYGGTDWDKAYSVKQTFLDGYIIAGMTESFGAGNKDVYLVRTDQSGEILWTKTCGGTSRDSASSVQRTSDNGYIIAGATSSFGAGGSDVYLIKLESDPLSVNTVSFSAVSESYYVKLQWRLEMEDDCLQYRILRKSIDTDYVDIAQVPGSGSSPGPRTYSYRDEDVIPGSTHYYKLGVVRTNGNTQWYGPVSARVMGIKGYLSISPNPFSEKVEIKFQITEDRGQNSENGNNESDISLLIFDVTGRKVREFILYPLSFQRSWNGMVGIMMASYFLQVSIIAGFPIVITQRQKRFYL
ncbi:hypothetical protein KAX75_06810 [candidate division WOR-3 bacterium]|nr:hypothetical protein [candidate division WOR-3 bacterium]